MPRKWRVFYSPDGYCVIIPVVKPDYTYPDHRPLSKVYNSQQEAISWRAQHCRKFPPNAPDATADWLCNPP